VAIGATCWRAAAGIIENRDQGVGRCPYHGLKVKAMIGQWWYGQCTFSARPGWQPRAGESGACYINKTESDYLWLDLVPVIYSCYPTCKNWRIRSQRPVVTSTFLFPLVFYWLQLRELHISCIELHEKVLWLCEEQSKVPVSSLGKPAGPAFSSPLVVTTNIKEKWSLKHILP